MFQTTLEYILGGSVIGLVIGLFTLKAKVVEANAKAREAKANADRAIADVEAVRITNADQATRLLIDNIVKPLKNELNTIREDLADARKEISMLYEIIKAANSCDYYRVCPVVHRLHDHAGEHDVSFDRTNDGRQRAGNRNKADPLGKAATL